MKRSETSEHRKLKEIISLKLEEWFGITLPEYQSSGHELDLFSVNLKGVTLMVEIIWTPSRTNFYRDLTLLQTSDAKVKILIVNPEILKNENMVREYTKVRISETRNGRIISPMIDGNKILYDDEYLNKDLKSILEELIKESQISLEMELDELRSLILSGSPLAFIIDKILKLKDDLLLSKNEIRWLMNELYGYDLTNKDGPVENMSEDRLPGNPEYRKIKAKLNILFRSNEVGHSNFRQMDYPLFLTHSVTNIERLVSDFKSNDILMTIPVTSLPDSQYEIIKKVKPGETKMPLLLNKYDLSNCLDEIRLRLHKLLSKM